MTFTKEQLQHIIETDHVQCGEASALARIALAALTAEPVGIVRHIELRGPDNQAGIHVSLYSRLDDGIELYPSPPAPVVPEEWQQWIVDAAEYLEGGLEADGELEAEGSIEAKRLLSRRAAMLQGGKS